MTALTSIHSLAIEHSGKCVEVKMVLQSEVFAINLLDGHLLHGVMGCTRAIAQKLPADETRYLKNLPEPI